MDQAIWMLEGILYIAVAYILLCKLDYDYHIQAHFHKFLPNGTLFSLEILWEKYELSCDTKFLKKFEKKVEKIRLGSFNYVQKLSNANDEIGWC